jgi:septum formation protein
MLQAGIPCEILSPDVDESVEGSLSPAEMVRVLSERKARRAGASLEKEARLSPEPVIIIAADTTVCTDGGRILGKPEDTAEAAEMLNMLQGRRHTVYTGVTLLRLRSAGGASAVHFVEAAEVFMRTLTENEIIAYIGTGEPMDKAGAYGIQGKGSLLIERVEGDYFTVVGLPMARLCAELQKLGADIFRWGGV